METDKDLANNLVQAEGEKLRSIVSSLFPELSKERIDIAVELYQNKLTQRFEEIEKELVHGDSDCALEPKGLLNS